MNGKGQTSAGNTPFRRVRDEEIEIDARVKNNSFEAKVSSYLFRITFLLRGKDKERKETKFWSLRSNDCCLLITNCNKNF